MTQFVTFVLLDNIVAYRFLFVVRLKFVGGSPSLSTFSHLFVRYWFMNNFQMQSAYIYCLKASSP
jgi:hypothetical protein